MGKIKNVPNHQPDDIWRFPKTGEPPNHINHPFLDRDFPTTIRWIKGYPPLLDRSFCGVLQVHQPWSSDCHGMPKRLRHHCWWVPKLLRFHLDLTVGRLCLPTCFLYRCNHNQILAEKVLYPSNTPNCSLGRYLDTANLCKSILFPDSENQNSMGHMVFTCVYPSNAWETKTKKLWWYMINTLLSVYPSMTRWYKMSPLKRPI